MPATSTLSAAQILSLSTDCAILGDAVRDIIIDPNIKLSNDQSNVMAADANQIYNIAGNLATWSANVVFADSDGAFKSLSAATQAASTKLKSLQKAIGDVNSMLSIAGAAISLGVAFGTGNFVSVVSASNNLATAVAKA